MSRSLAVLFVLPIALLASGCSGAEGTPTPPVASGNTAPLTTAPAQGGTAFGTIVDAQGKPLEDVTVDIQGLTTVGGGMVNHEPSSDAMGKYRKEGIPDGTYTAQAWRAVTYHDTQFRVPLAPVVGRIDDEFLSKDGIVRDFVWRLSGPVGSKKFDPKNPASYYGGTVTIDPYDTTGTRITLPAGTEIKGTFTPDGPLMDGSTGQAITFEVPYAVTGSLHTEYDLPLGRYKLTVSADGKPLQLWDGKTRSNAGYSETTTIDFEPNGSNGRPYGTAGAVKKYQVMTRL